MLSTKAFLSSHAEAPRRGSSVRWDRLVILLALVAFWALFAELIVRFVLR